MVIALSALPGYTAGLAAARVPAQARANVPRLKFDFGPGRVTRGYTQVLATTGYTKERGYGFDPGPLITCADRGGDELRGHLCTSDDPFFFSVACRRATTT